MKKVDSRRRFLAATAKSAGLAAGAVAASTNARAESAVGKSRKRVVTRPGQHMTAATILSPAIQFGNLLFVSGQTAHDPSTQKLGQGPFQDHVRQSLENVKAVLAAAGSSLDKVLKCTVFLTDIANFQAMNEVYHSYFPTEPPARSTMAVKDLPGGTPVEIECIAYAD